ncbi:MAG: GAF domain-containing protein [Fimbriimonadales bacterium]|nr:GAF domain-containing protein [Fimbriimonadales bacterium]
MGYAEQPEWGAWLTELDRGAPPEEAIASALRWLADQTQAQLGLLLLPDPTGEQVEFAHVVGARADELRGFRLRPHDTLLEPTLLQRTLWQYHAEAHQEPIGAIRTGMAAPLPALRLSAVALLNRAEPFEPHHCALLTQMATPIELLVRLQQAQQQLEQRERALKWLGRLPKRIGADLSLQHALEAIESLMRKAAPEGGGVWLYDENRRVLLQAMQYGASALPAQIPADTLPAEWVRAPVEVSWAGRPYRVYALTLAEQPLGLLALALPTETPDALEWVPPLLGHLALTLSNALLYEQTAQRAQHMAKLYELSLQLGEAQSLRAVLSMLCRAAHELIPHEFTVIYLPNRREIDRLTPVYVEPRSETLLNHSPDAQYSLPGWVYAFNAPIAAPDLAQHPQNLKEPLPGGFASALAVPLQVAERTLGVMMLLTRTPREFTLSEVELLFTLANTGALRLHALERVHA